MNYYQTDSYTPQSLDAKVSAVMKNVYVKMFLGLLLTALVAWGVAATANSDTSFLGLYGPAPLGLLGACNP